MNDLNSQIDRGYKWMFAYGMLVILGATIMVKTDFFALGAAITLFSTLAYMEANLTIRREKE